MNWRWVGATALLTAGVLSYGIFIGRNRMDQNAVEPPARLGYYFKNAVITETTDAGAPRIRLAARSIEQNPSDDSVSVEQVNVDYLAIPERPWNLQADSGRLPAESSALTFAGHVTLQPGVSAHGDDARGTAPARVAENPISPGPGDAGHVATRSGDPRSAIMHTDFLTIDSQKNVATTDSAVAIDVAADGGRQNRITALGLYADLNSAKVKLNSAVRGRFAPNGSPPNSAPSSALSSPLGSPSDAPKHSPPDSPAGSTE